MDGSIDVSLSVVNDLVAVLVSQLAIGGQRVGIKCRPRFDRFPNVGVQGAGFNVTDHPVPEPARFTLQEAHNHGLAHGASPANLLGPLVGMHVASLPANV